jgi:hypothetical protein
MTLAVLGTGLVSPVGLDPRQHALFARAGIGLNPPAAFLDDSGEPLDVRHCRWLGAEMRWAERLVALAGTAIDSAKSRPEIGSPMAAFICAPSRASASGTLTSCVAERAGCRAVEVFEGAAGFFGALAAAEQALEARAARAALVVAVDSSIDRVALEAFVATPQPTWSHAPPGPSEAAAAVVVVDATAMPRGASSMATIDFAGCAAGQGSDDDDAIVDGAALTTLLARAPAKLDPIVRSYGQTEVDRLRLLDWTYACARHSERFHPKVTKICPEFHTGSVGSAAGGVNFVFAIAAESLYAPAESAAGPGTIVAWAISRDGTRGLCTIRMDAV